MPKHDNFENRPVSLTQLQYATYVAHMQLLELPDIKFQIFTSKYDNFENRPDSRKLLPVERKLRSPISTPPPPGGRKKVHMQLLERFSNSRFHAL